MKIGIDARFLTHPQHGGFKTYTRSMVFALAQTDHENRYIVYTDNPPEWDLTLPANFDIKPVPGPNAVIREQLYLPIAMKLDDVDLAHFPCNTSPIFFAPPMVITLHDAIPLRRHPGGIRLSPKQRFLRAYWAAAMKRGARSARLVITVSQYARDDLCLRLKLGPEKFRIIGNAIDPVFARETVGRPPVGIDPNVQFVLAFASPDGRKNHAGSIEAFQQVRNRFPRTMLALVCSHPDVREEITCSANDGILPIGPVDTDELVWLHRNAQVLLFPSFDEGFGLPPLEAMASGTAVIASGVGPLPEILGDDAVFVDPEMVESIADALKLVLSDGELRARLVMQGRDRAARFSYERLGRSLCAAYSEAARVHGGKGVTTSEYSS